MTKASVLEQPEAHNLIKEIEAKHPRLLSRCEYFIADKEYNDIKLITSSMG